MLDFGPVRAEKFSPLVCNESVEKMFFDIVYDFHQMTVQPVQAC